MKRSMKKRKRDRKSLSETSPTAAAGSKGCASDIRSLENDHGHGEDREIMRRYFGNDDLNGRNSLYQKH